MTRRQKLLLREAAVTAHPPSTVAEIDAEISLGMLHPSHYLLFWAMRDLLDELASVSRHRDAFDLLARILPLLDAQLPPVHHERVIHYDKMAQLAVACEEVEVAKRYFNLAYAASRLACGEETPCTKQLQELATNTPRTVEELQRRYSSR